MPSSVCSSAHSSAAGERHAPSTFPGLPEEREFTSCTTAKGRYLAERLRFQTSLSAPSPPRAEPPEVLRAPENPTQEPYGKRTKSLRGAGAQSNAGPHVASRERFCYRWTLRRQLASFLSRKASHLPYCSPYTRCIYRLAQNLRPSILLQWRC